MTMFQNLRRSMRRTDTLKLACEACGHEVALRYDAATQRFGDSATPSDVRRRAICSGCGERQALRIWI